MTDRRRAGAVLLSVLLLAGCTPTSSTGAAVETAVADAAGGTFALSDVAGITGSAFLVVCPYETEESVEARLGADWNDFRPSGDEGSQTIAVLDGGQVEPIELGRDSVDFCSAAAPWALLPLDTRLAVTESRSVSVAA